MWLWNKENEVKLRILLIAAIFGIVAAIPTVALGATTFNPAAAPQGTHVQRGTPSCSLSGLNVSCSSYELAGVGNTNAQANLSATYSPPSFASTAAETRPIRSTGDLLVVVDHRPALPEER
jgi:hypothetical protein